MSRWYLFNVAAFISALCLLVAAGPLGAKLAVAFRSTQRRRRSTVRTRRRIQAPCARRASGGHTLLELAVCLAVIGMIASVAVPRMALGTAGASNTALSRDFRVLRKAIDLYAADHAG